MLVIVYLFNPSKPKLEKKEDVMHDKQKDLRLQYGGADERPG